VGEGTPQSRGNPQAYEKGGERSFLGVDKRPFPKNWGGNQGIDRKGPFNQFKGYGLDVFEPEETVIHRKKKKGAGRYERRRGFEEISRERHQRKGGGATSHEFVSKKLKLSTQKKEFGEKRFRKVRQQQNEKD